MASSIARGDGKVTPSVATWEQAAAKAAHPLTTDFVELGIAHVATPIDEIANYIDVVSPKHDCIEELVGCASKNALYYIADDALIEWDKTNVSMESREEVIDYLLKTLAAKQHDYGHENILWGGLDGVVLRMHDKVARIKNLQKRHEPHMDAYTAHPLNESLADSWLDIAGYAIIALMLEAGTFELPLAADLVQAKPAINVQVEGQWRIVSDWQSSDVPQPAAYEGMSIEWK